MAPTLYKPSVPAGILDQQRRKAYANRFTQHFFWRCYRNSMTNASFQTLFERPQDYVYTMNALTSAEAKRLWRAGIKKAWGDRCAYCGQPPIDDKSLTIDHVRPRAKGGEDRTSNVIPACRRCNQAKGSEEWIAWYRVQPYYSAYAELRIKNWLEHGVVQDASDADTNWLETLINLPGT